MEILLVEPFYSGSHKKWAQQLKKYSKHNIDLLTLDGKFWKWRMYGSAITLASRFLEMEKEYDLILTSDMIDVSVFISLTRKKLKNTPVATYFHENQFAYPWQEDSEDIKENRDVHYGMINYQTALSSDYNLFNSEYNMKSFLEGINKIIGKMPDNRHVDEIELLRKKCKVLHLGLEFDNLPKNIKKCEKKVPVILWNHRLDYDKSPETFFECLIQLNKENIPFSLLLLGEQTKKQLKKYDKYLSLLSQNIIFSGYASKKEYVELIAKADLLPVTSIHDFFGISIAEAIYSGITPLLPKRLSYIELYKPDINCDLFYDNNEQLYEKLKKYCIDINNGEYVSKDLTNLVERFEWKRIISNYDNIFKNIVVDITKIIG